MYRRPQGDWITGSSFQPGITPFWEWTPIEAESGILCLAGQSIQGSQIMYDDIIEYTVEKQGSNDK